MQTMLALLKREWLEHVFGFGWAPGAVLSVLGLITCLGLLVASFGTTTIRYSSETTHGEHHSSEQVEIKDSWTSLTRFFDFDKWSDEQLQANMKGFRLAVSRPFQLVYVLVAIFVLLGSLHEDRRDRSVLFWKSMPVTDAETVLSKLIAAVWVAPVAAIAGIIAAQLFLMLMVSVLIVVEDLGSVWRLWWHSGVLIGALQLVVGYLIQGFWALPLYAWLLAVSAIAPRVPFVWAIVVPFVPMAMERVVFGTEVIGHFVSTHAGFAALPGSVHVEDGVTRLGHGLGDQLALLATGQMWLGVAIGAALLWLAIYFRARNNDL